MYNKVDNISQKTIRTKIQENFQRAAAKKP